MALHDIVNALKQIQGKDGVRVEVCELIFVGRLAKCMAGGLQMQGYAIILNGVEMISAFPESLIPWQAMKITSGEVQLDISSEVAKLLAGYFPAQ